MCEAHLWSLHFGFWILNGTKACWWLIFPAFVMTDASWKSEKKNNWMAITQAPSSWNFMCMKLGIKLTALLGENLRDILTSDGVWWVSSRHDDINFGPKKCLWVNFLWKFNTYTLTKNKKENRRKRFVQYPSSEKRKAYISLGSGLIFAS